jgi:hypothetical protein
MNIDALVNTVFFNHCHEISFELNQTVSVKELSNVLYTLFMRGLVLLFGTENKVTLNHLTMDQIDKVVCHMKRAKVKTTVNCYDKDTAILLDLLPESVPVPYELYVLHANKAELESLQTDILKSYVYKMYMHGVLYTVCFEIIH